ncbi:hypothetical protein [Dietzia cinnamea]|uniref:Uncharacterized protein n=1 Tax=Dietzia cinnamea TaxID=321318 RepID=A0A4R3ZLF0_9ACTN|nr:hypothetical protein [Dietzia cinnamea]TCW19438.1 hypothetical protein EDD19_13817 [Dietzia cinnamea]
MTDAGPVGADGAVPGEDLHGLVRRRYIDDPGSVSWWAPAGTAARLDIAAPGVSEAALAGELQWSARCAQVPATRAVVLIGDAGAGDTATDFTAAHLVAESVAESLAAATATQVGPIEVLVFRPDIEHSPLPEPVPTADGVEFRFRHRGGADVHLALTIPDQPGEA